MIDRQSRLERVERMQAQHRENVAIVQGRTLSVQAWTFSGLAARAPAAARLGSFPAQSTSHCAETAHNPEALKSPPLGTPSREGAT